MYIRLNERFILIAFYSALSQLESPLPLPIQDRLKALTSGLSDSTKNISELDAIAETHQPLDEVYQSERTRFEKAMGRRERGKSHPPLPLSNQTTISELFNISIDTFSSSDPVSEARKNRAIVVRIWQSIVGNDNE